MASTPQKMHEALKEATKAIHSQLHNVAPFQTLLSEQINQDQYQKLLRAHFIYFEQMERHFSQITNRFEHEANVLHWLRLDLDRLGESILQKQLTSIVDIPINFSSYIGYCYVKQGSTLGARILLKRLQNCLAIDNSATRFFQGYGEHTTAVWQQFLAYLESNEQDLDMQQVCDSAESSFQLIYRILSKDSKPNL
jgi:heme oxygenase